MVYALGEKKPRLGRGVVIAPSADVLGDVELGDEVSVWFQAVIRGDVNSIRIGRKTNVQDSCCLHVLHDTHPLVIGEGVTLGHKVLLHGCAIGNHCLIGMAAVVLDGAEIGDECIIGACTLITGGKKFPPRSLILGNPGKVARPLKEEEIRSLYESRDHYLNYKEKFLRGAQPVEA